MNANKPYAWINVNDEYKILFDDELPNAYPTAWIPLYIHPIKELTDKVMVEHCTCYKLGYSPLNDYALVKQK